ncbi:DUF2946 family protein [Stenotrophomonas sp. ISL-67]|nr:DUF2946 family protein [Stenotrophomonas sp. ISL-67]MBT2766765.1 DUF2946 family protein [Stenotrophomonas sp. ISL-67]
MALAPLLSRWQQAQGDPVMVMPGGMAHVMPAAVVETLPRVDDAGMQHEGTNHQDMHQGMHQSMHQSMHQGMHHMPMASSTADVTDATRAPAAPPLDPHAGHGEACEYCMMASRLMPWLAVLILLLPALPVIAPAVLRTVAAPRSLRWPAHAARGPPLHA